MSYDLVSTSVPGGNLSAGIWNEQQPEAALAFHGITASHVSWRAVARALEGRRMLVAPDLRGRGGSRHLPGPFGMARHANDAVRLLDDRNLDRVDVVGHSMGGFVAMRFAANFPDRVRSITLIDGGVPLPLPEGIPIDVLMKQTLGPALARLSETYPSREAYREFWKQHPAFVGQWNADVEAYVEYDLVGDPPNLRSSASAEAALEDAVEQGARTQADEPWAQLSGPINLLTAPRGLQNGPALYPAEYLAAFAMANSNLDVFEVPDVNHYTILLDQRGADAVAAAVTNP